MKSPAHRDLQIDALRDAGNVHRVDAIAVEEPLEIRLHRDGAADNGGTGRPISITMRTPGNDSELALGFLFGEGLLREPRDVVEVRPCGPTGNVVKSRCAPICRSISIGSIEISTPRRAAVCAAKPPSTP